MTKKIISLISTVFILTVIFSGCTDDSKEIRIYNAAEYIADGVIEDFEKETGYKVVYSEFDSNESMYTKMKTTSYDVLIPSDYMIDRLIKEGLLQELDYSNIPNYSLVDDTFKNDYYDPENKYSVPYMWCTLGILYNTDKINTQVDSMEIMWNKDYEGKIFMLDSSRDSFGMTLKLLGYSVNTENENELAEAKEKMIEQRPLVLGYVTDEVKDKLISGEGYLGLVYSGEAGKAIEETENLRYVIPKEGTIYCVDAMVVPANANNKEGAEAFINFMQRPDIAARNAAEMYYGITNTEGKKLLSTELTSDTGLYPSAEVLAGADRLNSTPAINQRYLDIWNEIIAYN